MCSDWKRGTCELGRLMILGERREREKGRREREKGRRERGEEEGGEKGER